MKDVYSVGENVSAFRFKSSKVFFKRFPEMYYIHNDYLHKGVYYATR